MAAATHFSNGGTNFKAPMREAVRLMEQKGFQKADIVFITDGPMVGDTLVDRRHSSSSALRSAGCCDRI